jgi:hypothetical protein
MTLRNVLRFRELSGRVNFITRTPRTPLSAIDDVAVSTLPLVTTRTSPRHLRLGIYIFGSEALATLL